MERYIKELPVYPLIRTIILEKPPFKMEKWVNKYVKKKNKFGKLEKTGERKMTKVTHYLTANIFLNANRWLIHEVKDLALRYLEPHFKDIPKLEKCQLHVIIHHSKNGFDLDNKAYFWIKILLDLFKTPSSKQLVNSYKRGNDIVSVNCLYDDTVLYVDDLRMSYIPGGNSIEIRIYGKKLDEQQVLL